MGPDVLCCGVHALPALPGAGVWTQSTGLPFIGGDGALKHAQPAITAKELHTQFVTMLEAEMEAVLRARGWADPAEFQAALRDALAVGGGGAAAGQDEGMRVRRGAAAAELLELLDEMARFEQWADAMKRRGRELLELRQA